MKGLVFRKFLDLVEEKFGDEVADDVIEAAELSSGGAYTSVGTYHHSEMIQLVTQLSSRVELPVKDLLHTFADHLMAHFGSAHAGFFEAAGDVFSFLERVDDHVHVEVRKLYPDAELPRFACERRSASEMVMEYRSSRPFSELAHGLILAAARHYDEAIEVERGAGTEGEGVTFHIRRKAA